MYRWLPAGKGRVDPKGVVEAQMPALRFFLTTSVSAVRFFGCGFLVGALLLRALRGRRILRLCRDLHICIIALTWKLTRSGGWSERLERATAPHFRPSTNISSSGYTTFYSAWLAPLMKRKT